MQRKSELLQELANAKADLRKALQSNEHKEQELRELKSTCDALQRKLSTLQSALAHAVVQHLIDNEGIRNVLVRALRPDIEQLASEKIEAAIEEHEDHYIHKIADPYA